MAKENKKLPKSKKMLNCEDSKMDKKRQLSSSQTSNKRLKKEEWKNGNPRSNKAFTEEAKSSLKTYTRLKTIYEEEGINQKTHQFLTRITKQKVFELPSISAFYSQSDH